MDNDTATFLSNLYSDPQTSNTITIFFSDHGNHMSTVRRDRTYCHSNAHDRMSLSLSHTVQVLDHLRRHRVLVPVPIHVVPERLLGHETRRCRRSPRQPTTTRHGLRRIRHVASAIRRAWRRVSDARIDPQHQHERSTCISASSRVAVIQCQVAVRTGAQPNLRPSRHTQQVLSLSLMLAPCEYK